MPHHTDGIEIEIHSRDGVSKMLFDATWVNDNVEPGENINERFRDFMLENLRNTQRALETVDQMARSIAYVDQHVTWIP